MWVDYLDVTAILDALDLKVTGKFRMEDIIELLARDVGVPGWRKGEI